MVLSTARRLRVRRSRAIHSSTAAPHCPGARRAPPPQRRSRTSPHTSTRSSTSARACRRGLVDREPPPPPLLLLGAGGASLRPQCRGTTALSAMSHIKEIRSALRRRRHREEEKEKRGGEAAAAAADARKTCPPANTAGAETAPRLRPKTISAPSPPLP